MMRRVVALVLLLPAGACDTLADRPAAQHEVVDSAGGFVRSIGIARFSLPSAS